MYCICHVISVAKAQLKEKVAAISLIMGTP
jgi:hypothetical protein